MYWACVKLLWYIVIFWSLSKTRPWNEPITYWLHTRSFETSVWCGVQHGTHTQKKGAVKLRERMWLALKKDLSRDRNLLRDNKHHPSSHKMNPNQNENEIEQNSDFVSISLPISSVLLSLTDLQVTPPTAIICFQWFWNHGNQQTCSKSFFNRHKKKKGNSQFAVISLIPIALWNCFGCTFLN